MKDKDKTKEKLIRELTDLRRRLIELESSETRQGEMLKDLRKSEERYRLLVESSSDFIWEVDANGIYTYANSKVKDLLGYEPAEIIGKTPFDFMPAYEAERVARLFKSTFESQKPFQELENTNLHKDGHHVVLDTSGVPIFDTNGNLSGYRGIDRDVSERKKIEEVMKDTRDFSDNIIESSLDCIVISDRKGYLTRVNKYFLELLGYKEEEVLGKHIAEFAPPEEGTYELITGELLEISKDFFENQLSMMCLLVEKGKVSNWDAYYCRKDRKLIPIDQNIVYLYDKRGEKTGSVGISRDVTERRKVEKNLKETKAFLDNVIDSSLDCIVVSDRSGYLTRTNKSFLKLLGYAEGEVLGRHMAEFAPPEGGIYESTTGEEVGINEAYYKKQLAMMSRLVEKGGISNWEAYYYRKDKKLVPVGQSSSYLYNERGEKVGSVGVLRDITERRKAERDLKETKEFLDNIIESSQDCIIVSDTKGNLMRVNKYFLQLLGYKEEEVLGKHITEFTPLKEGIYESSTGTLVEINKEFFDRAYSMVAALIEAGKITNRETYFLTKDNKVIPTEENIVYLFNNAGKRIGAVGILRDITARKQAEEKLKETTDFLDNTLESLQDCVVVTDVNGYYKRVNKYFLELLGYEEEEVLGKHVSEFTPLAEGSYELITGESVKINGEFFDRVKSMISEFIDKGKISNWESYFVRKDKKLVFVEERMVYLYNNTGEKIGAVGIVRDATERKRAEKEIVEARDFLENIFRTSVDGIITTDCKGNITMVNRAVEEILGYSKDELVGKHTTELVPKSGYHKKRITEFLTTIMEEGSISEFEYLWLRKDGEEVDIEFNAAMLRDSKGEFAGIVSSLRDITDRKKSEKMLNEYQNQLRSLTSQLTLTEERARRRIATDLHDRIGQALAMSKIKLGSLRESASSIGLDGDVDKIRDLIEQTIQDTRSLIFDICPPLLYELGFEKAVEWLLENIQEEHGINALFEDDGIPKPLDDDIRVLLYQTVRELLMNVVKHAQAKKVMVSFEGNRGHVKISVEDDGIGFDPSKISSRVGKPEGFGLFRIVERLHYLGGEIQIESKPHHGTKISMVVPTEQSGQVRKEELK